MFFFRNIANVPKYWEKKIMRRFLFFQPLFVNFWVLVSIFFNMVFFLFLFFFLPFHVLWTCFRFRFLRFSGSRSFFHVSGSGSGSRSGPRFFNLYSDKQIHVQIQIQRFYCSESGSDSNSNFKFLKLQSQDPSCRLWFKIISQVYSSISNEHIHIQIQ